MLRIGPHGWGLRGDLLVEISVANRDLAVLAVISDGEVARRIDEGLPPGPLNRPQLSALAALPHGVPIPWREVDFDTRLLLDTLPPGAVRTTATTITRVWRPAVDVVTVASFVQPTMRGIEEISLFASVAPRAVRVDPGERVAPAVLDRAALLGVGAYAHGEPPEGLTPSPSRRRVRDDARRWEVAELAYRRAVSAGLTATSTPAPAAT